MRPEQWKKVPKRIKRARVVRSVTTGGGRKTFFGVSKASVKRIERVLKGRGVKPKEEKFKKFVGRSKIKEF